MSTNEIHTIHIIISVYQRSEGCIFSCGRQLFYNHLTATALNMILSEEIIAPVVSRLVDMVAIGTLEAAFVVQA